MKRVIAGLLLLALLTSAVAGFCQDPMKQASKEASEYAQNTLPQLIDILQGPHNIDDFLPEKDQGRRFDAEQAKHDSKPTVTHPDFVEMERYKARREHVEEAEPELRTSKAIISQPNAALSITSEETILTAEEVDLRSCHEAGSYQVSVIQTRKVNPAIDNQHKVCQGHKKTYKCKSPKQAIAKQNKITNELKKDASITSKDFKINGKDLKVKYKHVDDASTCDNFIVKGAKKGQTTEYWESSKPIESIEANPQCKLLSNRVLEGSATKIIKGQKVTRDIWKRQLFFACDGGVSTKCQAFREQGGVLLSKKCVKGNDFGECQLWEKTFDLGKKAASISKRLAFEKDEIYGLDHIAVVSDKNTDLGHVVATLSSFAELEQNLQGSGEPVTSSRACIFPGKAMKCQRSFLNNVLYDCCQALSGLAVESKLAACSSEEKCLSKYRYSGKCHFIGTKIEKMGTETQQVYCCFPTKLARIIHEQGRAQLGISWGTPNKPNYRGFTVQELQQIDFSLMDFSEITQDLSIDPDQLLAKLQKDLHNVQSNKLRSNTEELLTDSARRPSCVP